MNKMIFANLVHRPVRSLISIVAIAVEVTLILVIVGLSLGMLNDAKNRTLGIGADLMVQPPGSSFLSGISGAPVPAKVGDVIAKLPHVQVVSPVVTQLSTVGCARGDLRHRHRFLPETRRAIQIHRGRTVPGPG